MQVNARLGVSLCLQCFAGPDQACVHVKAANIELAEAIPRGGSFIEDILEQPPRFLEVLDARSTGAYSMDELVLFPPQVRYLRSPACRLRMMVRRNEPGRAATHAVPRRFSICAQQSSRNNCRV